MKHLFKPLLTALLLLCSAVINAHSFRVDGIYYNILSYEDITVEVTSGSIKYSGAVTIPASVTYNSITYSVTSIGDWAFFNCTSLTSIEIPSSVTSIGDYAFKGCDGLTSIVIDEENTVYDSRGNCNAIIVTATNTLIAGCKGTIIPSSVTSIGEGAFYYCRGLTSIEIPSSVTSIGESAFASCLSLTSIVVDEGNTIYDSRGNCNAIIKTASNTLIVGCKNTIIPEGVTSIGEGAFYSCRGLTSIEIPSSVTSIGEGAFYNCDGLTSIEIPSSVTSIGESAFYHCTSLTSIEIPSSVTSIGESAFEACYGLTSIVIPEGVTSIGNWAFGNCSSLTSIISEIPADKLFVPGSYAFYNVDKTNCTLYVPAGAVATYATTDGWKDFKNIVEFKSSYTITYKVDGEVYATDSVAYGAAIEPVAEPTKEGHTFSGWSEIPATMPAEDIIIEGSFSVNTYTVTFMIDGEVYETATVEYGAEIELPTPAEKPGYIFSGWVDVPATMPAEDIVIEGSYIVDTTGIGIIGLDLQENEVYNLKGQRVTDTENLVRGIYIVNGKKVFIK